MSTMYYPGVEPFAISLCITIGLVIINLILTAFTGNDNALISTVSEPEALTSNSYWHGTVRWVLRFAGFEKVRATVVVTSWFLFFGFTGYGLQDLSQKVTDDMLPLALAVPLAMPIALLFTRAYSAMLIYMSYERVN